MRQNIVVQCKNCLNGWWGLVVMIILFNTYLSCFLKGSARDLLADASFPFLTSYMMHRHIRDGRESEEAAPNLQSWKISTKLSMITTAARVKSVEIWLDSTYQKPSKSKFNYIGLSRVWKACNWRIRLVLIWITRKHAQLCNAIFFFFFWKKASLPYEWRPNTGSVSSSLH